MGRRSRFDLETRGGVTAGEEWICDDGQPIARLERVVVEQPEQNLRYFDRNLRPVVLRDLRLSPGGRPLVAGTQLFWNLDGHIITTELVEVTVDGRGTDRLTVTVTTADPGGVATSRRVLTITRDDDLVSYVYDFACHLELHSPEVFHRPGVEQVSFEYSDPWYCDVPAPTVAFGGAWSAHGYTHLLAEPADGTVWQMPLNHMATGIPSPRSFREGGLFVLASDPGHNPAFEFPGHTAARTSASVCNWGYDIHLGARYLAPTSSTSRSASASASACAPTRRWPSFRVEPNPCRPWSTPASASCRGTSDGRASRNPCASTNRPASSIPGRGCRPGDGAEWCRDHGRSDDSSLKIHRETAGVTEWSMDREGEGAFTQRWRENTGFRVSLWVRTEAVSGRGACLALRWIIYNHPERYPLVCSERLTGTRDWTRLTVEIRGPSPPEVSAVEIVLRQDGAGTSWFDDLEVEVL